MPKQEWIKKVLVIGSGPIVIGQAAEFDYAGTQGCIALREEGCEVILVNNNPATIMSDYADVVYFEPLTVNSLEKIIKKEKPDSLLASLGGQTALNLASELDRKGILQKYNVNVIGTSVESINKGENRESFRQLMQELNEPIPDSAIVTQWDEAKQFAEEIGFPIIVRPAYTLGGSGGGIAKSFSDYEALVMNGLQASPIQQCLVEKSIAGMKEIEFEVMRDDNDTCITVCSMENLDPVGIHTGDSIVVAPVQTLRDKEYQMFRTASLKIIRALNIVGGCNIQFALDPNNGNYYLIEVNPRVSRSSALASKAAGYPIARIAAKLCLGYRLDELYNPITRSTYASFEPTLDYIVVKIPRWPFDKFPSIDRQLSTQMKATGEVMAIDRTFEGALLKAIRSLDQGITHLYLEEFKHYDDQQLLNLAIHVDDRRLFVLAELLRRKYTVEHLYEVTKVQPFFLKGIERIVLIEEDIKKTNIEEIEYQFLKKVKRYGFSDEQLSLYWECDLKKVSEKRKKLNIFPSYKTVDTCAAEFYAETPYFFSTWSGECEVKSSTNKKMVIVGSGPIRIGQGIEFDYSSVHGVFSLKEEGYETIMINNNPETVSTDFTVADRLYFEPLTVEDVLNVMNVEQCNDVIIQYGGQTAISLAKGLHDAGKKIVGMDIDVLDQLEDRDRFYQLLQRIDVPHIPGATVNDEIELERAVQKIGFPLLLRPSYVIGGQGMCIIHNKEELQSYVNESNAFPILVDSYIQGKEYEADLITDGEQILIPTLVEHVEKAGVHSGDSMAIFPPISLSKVEKEKIEEYCTRIATSLTFKGIMNIQFVIEKGNIYVLEVNPRASRTVPIVSKITGIPMIQHATKLLLGKYLHETTKEYGIMPENSFYTIKYPVFSTNKLNGLDPILLPEMKSTGEGISIASSLNEAYYKTFYWMREKEVEKDLVILGNIDERDWKELSELAETVGFTVVRQKEKVDLDEIKRAVAYVNFNKDKESKESRLKALLFGVQVFTNKESFMAFIKGNEVNTYHVQSIQEHVLKHKTDAVGGVYS